MRIVLDTNVIIAAFAARGLCSEIFRYALLHCEVISSLEILKECEKTFEKKLKLPKQEIENILKFHKENFILLEPALVESKICRDKNDLHVLGVAISGKAKFIITGDDDLLTLKKYKNVKIYSPRQFWTYLNTL